MHRGIITLSLLAVFVGCGPKPPADFPKTYPCSIVVMKSGAPVEQATVILSAEGAGFPGGLVCTGMTDGRGKAGIKTSYASFVRDGAPKADYKVLIIKDPKPPETKTREEQMVMKKTERDAYEANRAKARDSMPLIVPLLLTKAKTTPIELTVSEGSNTLTVNVDDYKDPPGTKRESSRP